MIQVFQGGIHGNSSHSTSNSNFYSNSFKYSPIDFKKSHPVPDDKLPNGFAVHLPAFDCLMLSAILSATDSVAVLTMLKEEHYPKLNSIVFGEGVINDALSIVLFTSIKRLIKNEGDKVNDVFDLETAGLVTLHFFELLAESSLVGILIGLFTSFLLLHTQSLKQHPTRETALILLFGYLSYSFSEIVGLSGIMTLFIAGVMMAHYAWHNVSEQAQSSSRLVASTMSQISEGFVFVYLGLNVFTYSEFLWAPGFIAIMVLGVMLARAVSVFLLAAVARMIRGPKWQVSFQELSIIWWSGLIRGTIALALVLQVKTRHYQLLISTTLGVVLVTTLILGGLTSCYFRWMLPPNSRPVLLNNLTTRVTESDPLLPTTEHSLNAVQLDGTVSGSLAHVHKWWRSFDKRYMKPIFGGSDKCDDDILSSSNIQEKALITSKHTVENTNAIPSRQEFDHLLGTHYAPYGGTSARASNETKAMNETSSTQSMPEQKFPLHSNFKPSDKTTRKPRARYTAQTDQNLEE